MEEFIILPLNQRVYLKSGVWSLSVGKSANMYIVYGRLHDDKHIGFVAHLVLVLLIILLQMKMTLII